MSTDLSREFAEKSAAISLVTLDEYYELLTQLVARAQGFSKARDVGAFQFKDVKIETLSAQGVSETKKKVKVTPAFLVMDTRDHPLSSERENIVLDMTREWGKKLIHLKDPEASDCVKVGVYVNNEGDFKFDYDKVYPEDARDNLYEPSPKAFRVCLTADETIKIPVVWDGGFEIGKGGTLAVRERDYQQLADALESVRRGDKTVAEALYTLDNKGNIMARYDVYGMKPGFLESDYKEVGLAEPTRQRAATFAAPKV